MVRGADHLLSSTIVDLEEKVVRSPDIQACLLQG